MFSFIFRQSKHIEHVALEEMAFVKLLDSEMKHEEEIKVLKRKLEEKEKDLDLSKSKIEKQDRQISKQDHFLHQLKDKIECPVCMDIPRSNPAVCPNGHFVCQKCKSDVCHTCRTAMGPGKSLLVTTILENIDHKCIFDDCDYQFALEDLETHERSCLHRKIQCPDEDCAQTVSLSNLVDHLLQSENCCVEKTAPLVPDKSWNRRNFSVKDVSAKTGSWPIHIYTYNGETFAIFPRKSEGQLYCVVVMFTTASECSKYNIEMIVHERDSEFFNSKFSVKFTGSPLSIDGDKNDRKLYLMGESMMSKILQKSLFFSISFQIVKKEDN